MARFSSETFAQALRTAMASAGVSRQALAEFVGVNPATVSEWRGGKYLPDPEKRSVIAAKLNVSEEELFGSAGDQDIAALSKQKRMWLLEFELRLHRDYAATQEEIDAAMTFVVAASKAADTFMGTSPDIADKEVLGMRLLGSAVRREMERRRALAPPSSAAGFHSIPPSDQAAEKR